MERTVRNFRLVEQVGTGGMGVIWRAIQLTLDRPVAFKEMHPHLAKDQEFTRRFEREAKTAATLQHENIVGVIDFGQEGDTFFLALEFVDGSDLKVLLAKDPKVVLPVALTVMKDVLAGLEHAHARGVVHRDVKPANVMITKDGIAKIADFSIAQAQALPSMTVTGAMLGTPAYMSPEQAAGGRPLDARTDLFSAGVILYEMLGGVRPFDGDTYATIISRLLTQNPTELNRLDPVVPESIARVARRALEKDPDKRYASAADFRRDLENVARDEKIPVDRALVAEWVKSPKEFQDALKRRQAQELYQRGLYLKNQGLSHIDEAIRALSSVLSLDPTNAEAKRHLEELLRTKEDSVVLQRKSVLRAQQRKSLFLGAGIVAGVGALVAAVAHFAPTISFDAHVVREAPTAVAVAATTTALPPPSAAASPTPAQTPVAALSSAPTSTPRPVATKVAKATPPPAPTAASTNVAIAATPAPAATPPPAPTAAPAKTPSVGEVTLVDPELRDEGFLKLSVKPWAKVYIDGKYVGDTPFPRPMKISKGPHTLTLTNPGFPDHEETIEIPPGSMLTRQVQLGG